MMRRNVFFRLRTNSNHPQFNIHLREKGELYLPLWGHIGHTVPHPSDPDLPNLKMHLAMAPDASLIPTELYVAPLRGKKPVTPEKIPDFWTAATIPVVSDRFMNALEQRAPGSGFYFPITLYDFNTGLRFPRDYFAFICRHVVEFKGSASVDWRAFCDASALSTGTAAALDHIRRNPECLSLVESFDIWTIYQEYHQYFVSVDFVDWLVGQNFKGLKIAKNLTKGDLSHVWIAAPSPNAGVAAADEAASLTADSRFAASVAS